MSSMVSESYELASVVTRAFHCELEIDTRAGLEIRDITDEVTRTVRSSGVTFGWINVQIRHTTAAILVNENEPLLLEDLKDALSRFAPENGRYHHDDMARRSVNLEPGEPANGYAHVRALMLGASATLNIVDGRVCLGPWQSVFLVELDRPRRRRVSMMVMGQSGRR